MMKQYIQREHVEVTELDGEWILLNTDQYTITKINAIGGHCWLQLVEAQTVETLTHSLVEKFDLHENKKQVEKDMAEFLAGLHTCGLIQDVD